MVPSTLKRQWWKWVARQKIDPVPGSTRNTASSRSEWLGHSDPATRLRHYVSLTTAARAKAVAGRCARKPPLTPPRVLAADVRLWSG